MSSVVLLISLMLFDEYVGPISVAIYLKRRTNILKYRKLMKQLFSPRKNIALHFVVEQGVRLTLLSYHFSLTIWLRLFLLGHRATSFRHLEQCFAIGLASFQLIFIYFL